MDFGVLADHAPTLGCRAAFGNEVERRCLTLRTLGALLSAHELLNGARAIRQLFEGIPYEPDFRWLHDGSAGWGEGRSLRARTGRERIPSMLR